MRQSKRRRRCVGRRQYSKDFTLDEPEPSNDPDRTYFVVQTGVDCTKGSIGIPASGFDWANPVTYSDCQADCLADPDCVGFQFIENCPINPGLSTQYYKLPKVKYTDAYISFFARLLLILFLRIRFVFAISHRVL